MLLLASCHCQNIQIKIMSPPKAFYQCQCEYCRRFAAIWAEFDKKNVVIKIGKESTTIYAPEFSDLNYYFCKKCGCLAYRQTRRHIHAVTSINCQLPIVE